VVAVGQAPPYGCRPRAANLCDPAAEHL